MIVGVGVDLLELTRMRRLLERHAALSRLFGPRELAWLARTNKLGSYTANFCAKEAFAKALGTGVRGFVLPEVETLRDAAGKPYFYLSGRAAERARGLAFSLSLTHDRSHAAAFVIAEKRERT